jgi:hypothetical protein
MQLRWQTAEQGLETQFVSSMPRLADSIAKRATRLRRAPIKLEMQSEI